MAIRRIQFSQFTALLGRELYIDDDVDFGCGWYVAGSGEFLGRLSVNLVTEQWNRELYGAVSKGCISLDWASGFESYYDAQQDLLRNLIALVRYSENIAAGDDWSVGGWLESGMVVR